MRILFPLLFSFLSHAAVSPKLVRESALKYHPAVRGAIDRLLAGEDAIQGAQGAFDAKLVGEHYRVATGMWRRTLSDVYLEKPIKTANARVYAGYSYGFNGMFPPQFSTVSTNSGGSPRVGLAASLWKYRALDPRRALLKNAEFDAQATKNTKLLTEWDIGRLAEIAYWEWITALRIQTVFESLLKNGEDRREQLESRAQRGDAPRILVRENEQYIASRRAGLFAANERRVRAEFELSLFLRDEQGLPVLPSIEGGIEDFPADFNAILQQVNMTGNIDQLAKLRPELTNLGIQYQKNELDLQLAHHDLKPKVDLWGDYTRNMGNEDPTNPPHVWSVGVKLEIPIERNLGEGNVSAARNRLNAAQRDWDLAKQTYQTHILAGRSALALQLGRLEQSQIQLSRARELVEAEHYKFKTGGGNLFLVNLREEAAANAETAWHESRFAFMSTLLGYKTMTLASTGVSP